MQAKSQIDRMRADSVGLTIGAVRAVYFRAIAHTRGNPEQRAISNRVPLTRLPSLLVDALAEMFTKPEFQKLAARLIGSVPTSPKLIEIYWNSYHGAATKSRGELAGTSTKQRSHSTWRRARTAHGSDRWRHHSSRVIATGATQQPGDADISVVGTS